MCSLCLCDENVFVWQLWQRQSPLASGGIHRAIRCTQRHQPSQPPNSSANSAAFPVLPAVHFSGCLAFSAFLCVSVVRLFTGFHRLHHFFGLGLLEQGINFRQIQRFGIRHMFDGFSHFAHRIVAQAQAERPRPITDGVPTG